MSNNPVLARSPSVTRLSNDELNAFRGFLRVHSEIVRRLDAQLIAEHSLPLTSYEVLAFLTETELGSMRMSDLAESVLLSRSGLTRLVDRLECAGLVERECCESDARGQNAVITRQGRERFHSARVTHLAGIRQEFLSHFGDADLANMAAMWERVLPGSTHTGAGCGNPEAA